MTTTEPLTRADFPLKAVGQYVYRRTSSSPLIGPVSTELAVELATRLNREEADHQAMSMGVGGRRLSANEPRIGGYPAPGFGGASGGSVTIPEGVRYVSVYATRSGSSNAKSPPE